MRRRRRPPRRRSRNAISHFRSGRASRDLPRRSARPRSRSCRSRRADCPARPRRQAEAPPGSSRPRRQARARSPRWSRKRRQAPFASSTGPSWLLQTACCAVLRRPWLAPLRRRSPLFQGARMRTLAIPQNPVTPAIVSPAPTNAGTAKNHGETNRPSIVPGMPSCRRQSAPAAAVQSVDGGRSQRAAPPSSRRRDHPR